MKLEGNLKVTIVSILNRWCLDFYSLIKKVLYLLIIIYLFIGCLISQITHG